MKNAPALRDEAFCLISPLKKSYKESVSEFSVNSVRYTNLVDA
jgi:hypothetical protein